MLAHAGVNWRSQLGYGSQVGREVSGLALNELPDDGWSRGVGLGELSQVRGYGSRRPWWQQGSLRVEGKETSALLHIWSFTDLFVKCIFKLLRHKELFE